MNSLALAVSYSFDIFGCTHGMSSFTSLLIDNETSFKNFCNNLANTRQYWFFFATKFCTTFSFKFRSIVFVLKINFHFEALTTQLRNLRRRLKQKQRNFEITEILKRRNFEADAERGDANRGISVPYI